MKFLPVLSALASVAFARLPFSLTASDDGVNKVCLLAHCGLDLAKCLFNSQCRACTTCMNACVLGDAICQSRCFFQYSNEAFMSMSTCGQNHKCLPHMTWSNGTCPDMSKHAARVPAFDVQLLAAVGTMYVARGSHPVYDCFNCQKLSFVPAPGGGVATTWSVDIGTPAAPIVRSAHYTLLQTDPNSIITKYTLFGMDLEEHYFILDYTTSNGKLDFVFYMYCGFGQGGEYQGSVIYSREAGAIVPPAIEKRFAKVLEGVHLEEYIPKLADYCSPSYPSCANI